MYFTTVLVALAAIASTHAFPASPCDFPPNFHGVEPQKSPLPYEVKIEKNQLKPGESTKITLQGKEGLTFRGFFIQAKTDKERVGEFSVLDNSSRLVNCGTGNAVTQGDNADKKEVSFVWKAPADFKGLVNLHATVVKVFDTYWVNVKINDPIKVSS